jgi:hypothetical protein
MLIARSLHHHRATYRPRPLQAGRSDASRNVHHRARSGAGEGSLTIEHPEARHDVADYTHGVEGALRAYEVLVRSTPDAHFAALDDRAARHRGAVRVPGLRI